MSYFNVDWLDEDRLDLEEGLQLDEFGNPVSNPNISALMQDYLIEDIHTNPNFSEIMTGGIGEAVAETIWDEMLGEYVEIPSYTTIEDDSVYVIDDTLSGGGKEKFTGAEIWERSGARRTLDFKEDYDQFTEGIKKKSAILDIEKSINEIDKAQRIGFGKTKHLQKLIGRTGFSKSGKLEEIQKSHYGDMDREIRGHTGNIKKRMLGYSSDVNKLRSSYIDDTWALYNNWLDLNPDRYVPEAHLTVDQDQLEQLFDEGQELIGDLIPEYPGSVIGDPCEDPNMTVEQSIACAEQYGSEGFAQTPDNYNTEGEQGEIFVDVVDSPVGDAVEDFCDQWWNIFC